MISIFLLIVFKLHENNILDFNQIKLLDKSNPKLLAQCNQYYQQHSCEILNFDGDSNWKCPSGQNYFIKCSNKGSKVTIQGTKLQKVISDSSTPLNGLIHIQNANFESTINTFEYCGERSKLVQLIYIEGEVTHKISGTSFKFCGRRALDSELTTDWDPSLIYFYKSSGNTITQSSFSHPETDSMYASDFSPVRCIRISDLCDITVTETDFCDGHSFEKGGGFFWLESRGKRQISDCNFKQCSDGSPNRRHAIFISGDNRVDNSIKHCTFTDCAGAGVLIFVSVPDFVLEDCTFTFNDQSKICRCVE